MNSLKRFFESVCNRHDERRKKVLDMQAHDRFQVREYMGKLFVCVDEVPLIEADKFKESFDKTLLEMRSNYVSYHIGKQGVSLVG